MFFSSHVFAALNCEHVPILCSRVIWTAMIIELSLSIQWSITPRLAVIMRLMQSPHVSQQTQSQLLTCGFLRQYLALLRITNQCCRRSRCRCRAFWPIGWYDMIIWYYMIWGDMRWCEVISYHHIIWWSLLDWSQISSNHTCWLIECIGVTWFHSEVTEATTCQVIRSARL